MRKNDFFQSYVDVTTTLLQRRRFTDIFKMSQIRCLQDAVNTKSSARHCDEVRFSRNTLWPFPDVLTCLKDVCFRWVAAKLRASILEIQVVCLIFYYLKVCCYYWLMERTS